jgi:hypothetical protein
MTEELVCIARWLERQPWNAPGTDKTWVLKGHVAAKAWNEQVRRAVRVG